MEILVSRANLLAILNSLKSVIQKGKNIAPALTSIRLAVSTYGRLEVSGTDMDVFSTATTVARTEGSGEIVTLFTALRDVVRGMSGDVVTLRSGSSYYPDGVYLECDGSTVTLPCLDPEVYPQEPGSPDRGFYSLYLPMLRAAFERTSFCITKDDPGSQFNGALVTLHRTSIEVAATDGYRLSVAYGDTDYDHPTIPPVMWRRAMIDLVSSLPGDLVSLAYVDRDGDISSYLRVDCGGDATQWRVVYRVPETRFPQYTRVIDRKQPHHVSCDRRALLDATKRVGKAAHERVRGVRYSLAGRHLVLESIGGAGSARETLPLCYSGPGGDGVQVALSSAYVAEMLGKLKSKRVKMTLPEMAGNHVGFSAEDTISPLSDWCHVLMPVRQ